MIDDDARGSPRFHTKAFEKLDGDRRESLIAVALAEFARSGFNGTSVNDVARKAGVSIGALYSYFPSKDDLFLSLVERGRALIEGALSDIDPDADLFETYGTMLRRARDYAKANPELNRVYLDATTQGLSHLADRLSARLEAITADLYRRMLAKAAERGEIRTGLDLGATAFCLDNLLMLFQFSFSSDYYRDRLRIFLGLGPDDQIDDEALVASIESFARRALS